MKNWFKKLLIPSGEKTTVVAYNSWVVRWRSWRGSESYNFMETKEAEIFPSEEDANKFAIQLKEAFKLTRCHGGGFDVTVTTNQSKMAEMPQ